MIGYKYVHIPKTLQNVWCNELERYQVSGR